MKLHFYGVDQEKDDRNIDNVLSKVVKATGRLTNAKWTIGREVYLDCSTFTREQIAQIMAASKDFAGERILS